MLEEQETGEGQENQSDDNSTDSQGGGENDPGYWKGQFEAVNQKFSELSNNFKSLESNYQKTRTELKNTKQKHAGTPEGREDLEKHLRNEYEERFTGEIADLRNQISTRDQQIRRLVITNNAKSLAAKYFQSDLVDLIVREVEQQCDLNGDEIVVKDGSGTVRKSSNARGQNLSLDELFQELAKKYPSGTSPKIKSGTMPNHDRVNGSSNGSGEHRLPAGFDTWGKGQQEEWFAKNKDARKAFLANWPGSQ